jgi:hypothetical protein
MYEIYRVGIPLRDFDISNSFLEVIENIKTNNNHVGLTTVDFDKFTMEKMTAPAGYNLLFNTFKFESFNGSLKSGIINTYGKIWDIPNESGKFRDNMFLSKQMFKFLDENYSKNKFSRVYMFTPGSPYIYDLFTNGMRRIRPISLIDAPSAITICRRDMEEKSNLGKPSKLREYTLDFLQNASRTITKEHINIFGSIDNTRNYNTNVPMLYQFFLDIRELLNDDDIFMYTTIKLDGVHTTITTFKEAFNNYSFFANSKDILTYGVYRK